MQISVWPMMTVKMFSVTPIDKSTTRSEIETMISGRTSGSMISPMIGPLPGNSNRVEARAANIPRQVAKTEDETAMISEFATARRRVAFSNASTNHCVVKPFSGKEITVPLLKAKIGKSRIGA